MLRHQTASVKARHRRTKYVEVAHACCHSRQLPKDVVPSFEATALGFLFTHVFYPPRQHSRLSHYQIESIICLYQATACDSVLAHTVSWLAVLMIGTCPGGTRQLAEKKLFAKAVKGVREAVSHQAKSLEDETLAAIMLLQFGGYSLDLCGNDREGSLLLHQKGIEALVDQRGKLNYKNKQALTLLAAARNRAVTLTNGSRSHRQHINWDIWSGCDVGQIDNIDNPVIQLDTHCITLMALERRLVNANAIVDQAEAQATSRQALTDLLTQLSCWELELPSDWLPRRPRPLRRPHVSEDVTYFVARYHLLRLETFHLTQAYDEAHPPRTGSKIDFLESLELMNSIIESARILSVRIDPYSCNGDDHKADIQYSNLRSRDTGELRPSGKALSYLDLVVCQLEYDLRKALTSLHMPHEVAARYKDVLSWARAEKNVLRGVFIWPRSMLGSALVDA